MGSELALSCHTTATISRPCNKLVPIYYPFFPSHTIIRILSLKHNQIKLLFLENLHMPLQCLGENALGCYTRSIGILSQLNLFRLIFCHNPMFKMSSSTPSMLCAFIHAVPSIDDAPPTLVWKMSIHSWSFNSNVSFAEIFAAASALSQVFCSYQSQSTNTMLNFRFEVTSYSQLYFQWPVHSGT